MKFDRKVKFTERCRARMSRRGCKDCGATHPHGLFLKGEVGLRDLVRTGADTKKLKEEMRKRGWYCRKCVNRYKRIVGVATPSLRDQFKNQEEYFEFLFWRKNGDERFEETYKKPYAGLRMS